MESKTVFGWLEDAFEQIEELRGSTSALTEEVRKLTRDLDTERRLRLGSNRTRPF